MSWTQEYHIPPVEELFEKLTKTTGRKLLEKELAKKGIKIKTKKILLAVDDFCPDVHSYEVELSDGRKFVPVFKEAFTQDGNYGCDIYEWKEVKNG